MQKSLFTAALGLGLFGVMLSSSTDKVTAASAAQSSDLQGLPVSTDIAEASPKIPFTFYLTLLTTFANGGSIDFEVMNPDEQSFFWDKMKQ